MSVSLCTPQSHRDKMNPQAAPTHKAELKLQAIMLVKTLTANTHSRTLRLATGKQTGFVGSSTT